MRTLLAHAESGYEEWGASGAILVASSASGRGLTLRLAPAWGTASDRTEHLWSAHDTTAPAIGEEFEAEGRGRFDMAVLARTIGEVALHRCPIGSPAPGRLRTRTAALVFALTETVRLESDEPRAITDHENSATNNIGPAQSGACSVTIASLSRRPRRHGGLQRWPEAPSRARRVGFSRSCDFAP